MEGTKKCGVKHIHFEYDDREIQNEVNTNEVCSKDLLKKIENASFAGLFVVNVTLT